MREQKVVKKLKRTLRSWLVSGCKRSYSQCGEDLIVRYIFDVLKIKCPNYLDIGAHHPTQLSNTYLLYRGGAQGVTIEPDPSLFSVIRRKRPRDINLNVGLSEESSKLDFYVMSSPTLNTFSKLEAQNAEQSGVKIEKVLQIQVLSVDEVLEEHFIQKGLDFLSVDVEGLDLAILESIDFQKYRPKVICAETISYSEGTGGEKLYEIHRLLEPQGYKVYADTYINTIFIDSSVW